MRENRVKEREGEERSPGGSSPSAAVSNSACAEGPGQAASPRWDPEQRPSLVSAKQA